MNINEWFKDAQKQLDKQELSHLKVHKGEIILQLKNEYSKDIELHQFTYTAKDAENLKIAKV